MGSKEWRVTIALAALLVLLPVPLATLAAEEPPPAVSAPSSSVPRGEKSQLPYPAGAEVWVDATGVFDLKIDGLPKNAVTRVRVVTFQPKDDQLTWPGLTALYVAGSFLKTDAKPALQLSGDIPGVDENPPGVRNAKETNIYVPEVGGDRLALGFVRNQISRHLLAYAVLIQGTLDNAQAVTYARMLINRLASQAAPGPVAPPGGREATAKINLSGDRIGVLSNAIQRDPSIGAAVKAMALRVLGQATSISMNTFQSQFMPDVAFVSFYTQLAGSRGWGKPIVEDRTHPGQPTLLFQKPRGGVVMIKGQIGSSGTVTYWVDIDGSIDTGNSGGK